MRSIKSDLAPGDGLIGLSTSVRAIELLSSVNEDRIIGSIPHQVGVANVMLNHTTSKDEHATSSLSLDSSVIKLLDILS